MNHIIKSLKFWSKPIDSEEKPADKSYTVQTFGTPYTTESNGPSLIKTTYGEPYMKSDRVATAPYAYSPKQLNIDNNYFKN